jgi:hypothetical protein
LIRKTCEFTSGDQYIPVNYHNLVVGDLMLRVVYLISKCRIWNSGMCRGLFHKLVATLAKKRRDNFFVDVDFGGNRPSPYIFAQDPASVRRTRAYAVSHAELRPRGS